MFAHTYIRSRQTERKFTTPKRISLRYRKKPQKLWAKATTSQRNDVEQAIDGVISNYCLKVVAFKSDHVGIYFYLLLSYVFSPAFSLKNGVLCLVHGNIKNISNKPQSLDNAIK